MPSRVSYQTQEQAWDAIHDAHPGLSPLPRRGPLPRTGKVLLYVGSYDGTQIVVGMGPTLSEAVEKIGLESSQLRPHGFFVEGGTLEELRLGSPLLDVPQNILQRGRPRIARSQVELGDKAPRRPGVYRISRRVRDPEPAFPLREEMYVGQAMNLRRRLLQHQREHRWSVGPDSPGLIEVEILPVKRNLGPSPMLLVDLDAAEREHIERAENRSQEVANQYRGGNGRKAPTPSQSHTWIAPNVRPEDLPRPGSPESTLKDVTGGFSDPVAGLHRSGAGASSAHRASGRRIGAGRDREQARIKHVRWLTQEAYDALAAELADREGPRRAEIVKRIEAAREEGDLKENGGYHAAKDEQGKNEARILQLGSILDSARIGAPDSADDEVAHGKVVTVLLTTVGLEQTFLFASREEAAHAQIQVYSPDSPLGQAIMGKRVGDTAEYQLPNGKTMTAEVKAVSPYRG